MMMTMIVIVMMIVSAVAVGMVNTGQSLGGPEFQTKSTA